MAKFVGIVNEFIDYLEEVTTLTRVHTAHFYQTRLMAEIEKRTHIKIKRNFVLNAQNSRIEIYYYPP